MSPELNYDIASSSQAVWAQNADLDSWPISEPHENIGPVGFTLFIKNEDAGYYVVQVDEDAVNIVCSPVFDQIEENLNIRDRITRFLDRAIPEKRLDIDEIVRPRINELLEDIENDFQQETIDFESFTNFISFLQKNKDVTIPSFVITYEGNIRALWRKSRMQHLAVEFEPDGSAIFVIFRPNKKNPEKIVRSSGMTNQEDLYREVLSMGANKWICKK